jgi:hypothetical protein
VLGRGLAGAILVNFESKKTNIFNILNMDPSFFALRPEDVSLYLTLIVYSLSRVMKKLDITDASKYHRTRPRNN